MRRQRTLKNPLALSGRGIHSGKKTTVSIKNAPADNGVVFIRTDLKGKPAIAATVSNLAADSGNFRCTCLEKKGVRIRTIEHLMAALGSLGIDNAVVEVDNEELPALDGSALDFAREIRKAGLREQKKEKKELMVRKAISCREKDSSLTVTPARDFAVSYSLRYNGSGKMAQEADFSFEGAEKRKDIFIREIAPARTFCLESEAKKILAAGLGKGGSYRNALVLREGKPIKNKFRFANEPARHKIVDLLGDLSLINADIKAHVRAVRSGHLLNARLLRKLEKLL